MFEDDIGFHFIDLDHVTLLNPEHAEMPIYVPSLRSTLSIGHFVVVSNDNGKSIVGKIIGRSKDPDYQQHSINVCCYLPLFSAETIEHINNPALIPRRICSTQCLEVVELVNICKGARVNISSIANIAFMFLEFEVNNHLYCIQGMMNAFVI